MLAESDVRPTGRRDRPNRRNRALFAQLRGLAPCCAPYAAVFLHPQLAQLKHDQRGTSGVVIKPVIEIAGYAAPPPVGIEWAVSAIELPRVADIKHEPQQNGDNSDTT
jgi:hypothetical protein